MRNALPMRLLMFPFMLMLQACGTTTPSSPPNLASQIAAAHAEQKAADCNALATEHPTAAEAADPITLNYATRVGARHLAYCRP